MPAKTRTITLEQYQQLDADMAGCCMACGHEQHGCEPDARRYKCEACGERQVYGPHEYLMMGLVS
jgi:hypothetical protein